MASLITAFPTKRKLKCNTSATGANVASNLANFPVCVVINSDSWTTASDRATFFGVDNFNGKRVQFFDADGTTNLDYEVESYDPTNQVAIYWVRVPQVDGNSSADFIWIAYGNDPNGANQDNPTGVWDANYLAIYHGNSVWQKYDQVISPATDWLYISEPSMIYEDGLFKVWYREGPTAGGAWRLVYRTSSDGITWSAATVVLDTEPVIWTPFVFKYGSTYYLYFNRTGGHCDRWTSSDGLSWTKDKVDALTLGAGGQWDDYALGNFFVWAEAADDWRMIYEAQQVGGQWKLGYATSTDGQTWTKSGSNPVISNGSGPDIHKIGSTYYLWYHKAVSGNLPTDISRAYSTDLINWTLEGKVFFRTLASEGVTNASGQVADVSMVEVNGYVYMLYDQYPDQNSATLGLAIAHTTIAGLTSALEMSAPLSDSTRDNDATVIDVGDIDGKAGRAEIFNGSSSRLQIPDNAPIKGLISDFTFSFLIKGTALANTREFVNGRGGVNGWSLGVNATYWIFTKRGVVDLISTVAPSNGVWYDVTVTVSATYNPTLYINGVSAYNFNDTQTIVANSNTNAIQIGCDVDSLGAFGLFLSGIMDEIRVSSTSRAADWILLTYFSTKKTTWNGDGWLSWDAAMSTGAVVGSGSGRSGL